MQSGVHPVMTPGFPQCNCSYYGRDNPSLPAVDAALVHCLVLLTRGCVDYQGTNMGTMSVISHLRCGSNRVSDKYRWGRRHGNDGTDIYQDTGADITQKINICIFITLITYPFLWYRIWQSQRHCPVYPCTLTSVLL